MLTHGSGYNIVGNNSQKYENFNFWEKNSVEDFNGFFAEIRPIFCWKLFLMEKTENFSAGEI